MTSSQPKERFDPMSGRVSRAGRCGSGSSITMARHVRLLRMDGGNGPRRDVVASRRAGARVVLVLLPPAYTVVWTAGGRFHRTQDLR
jgi:hypothetical protein